MKHIFIVASLLSSLVLGGQDAQALSNPYRHKSFDTQLKRYYQIYGIFGKTPSYEQHIPNLIDVFFDGCHFVYDFIRQDIEYTADKEVSFDRIVKLYIYAVKLDGESKFSSHNFIKLNLLLAAILDLYKLPELQTSQFKRSDLAYARYVDAIRKIDTLCNNFERWPFEFSKLQNSQLLFFVLYSKKGIQPKRFVDAYFHPTQPAYLGELNVNQLLKDHQTKQEPHWSFFQSVLEFLYHDLLHATESFRLEREVNKRYTYSFKEMLRDEFEKYNFQSLSEHEASMVYHAFFLAIHETFARDAGRLPDFESIKASLCSATHAIFELESYKRLYRDREFVLYQKYGDVSFMPKAGPDKRVLPMAQHEGAYYVVIEEDPQAYKGIKLNDQENLSTLFALPKDIQFISIQDRKSLDTSIQNDRRRIKQNYLEKGYQAFWGHARRLAEKSNK